MNPKEKDIPYCGVNIDKIKNANPKIDLELLKRYAYYQKERTLIYYKKEILKEEAPWSTNPMFQNFKFTMTKRWLDRESKNLIANILNNPDISYDNKLLNCIAFRLINKFKAFDVLPEKYIDFDKFSDVYINSLKQILIDKNLSGIFTDAYFISGTLRSLRLLEFKSDKNIPKGESNPYESFAVICRYVYNNRETFLKIKEMQTPNEIIKYLGSIYGLGQFLSYQIYSDWSYIEEFPFSDKEVCDIGPGTERGLKHLFVDFDGLNLQEAVFWIKDNIQKICEENELEWDLESWFSFLEPQQRYWGCGDICNSFCEFDKTTRIWTEELQKENGKRVRKFKTERKLEEW